MDELEIKSLERATRERYDARLDRLGSAVQALGWDSEASQRARFLAAMRLAPTGNRAVLDVGCGFGDLLTVLRDAGAAPAEYLGVDLNPRLLEVARQRHPDAQFECRNLLVDPLPAVADVVFMFGLLNFRLPERDNRDFAREMITAAWISCKDVLVVDALSSVLEPAYPEEKGVFYYDPGWFLSCGLELTPHATLAHDFASLPQREMQLILRRTPN